MNLPAAPATARRRGTEAGLLVFGLGIIVVAYANVGLAQDDRIPAGTLGYGAGLAVLFLVAHLAVRRFAPYADPLLLPTAALLNGMGLVLIRRLDIAAADKAAAGGRDAPAAAASAQLEWTVLGTSGSSSSRLRTR